MVLQLQGTQFCQQPEESLEAESASEPLDKSLADGIMTLGGPEGRASGALLCQDF